MLPLQLAIPLSLWGFLCNDAVKAGTWKPAASICRLWEPQITIFYFLLLHE